MLLLVLVGLLVFPAVAMQGARAANTVTFATTADWDSGTKASIGTSSDTCENVTQPNAMQLNNTGSYVGVGMTRGTSTCASGAWGVNPSGLSLAFDMQTVSGGQLKDFSPNNNHGPFVGGGSFQSAKFGNGRTFRAQLAQYVNVTSSASLNITGALTLFAWVKFNLTTAQQGIIEKYNPVLVNKGYLFRLLSNGTLAGFTVTAGGVIKTVYQTSGSITAGTEYATAFVYTGTTLLLYLNGAQVGSTTAVNNPGTTYSGLKIGGRGDTGTPFSFNGTIDEALVFSRALTAVEITALATDGRSSFVSSGTWTSPTQQGELPIEAIVSFTNQTSVNRVSRFQVLSGSGSVVYDKLVPFFSTSPFQIPLNVTFNPATWKVKLFMSGSGTATSQVTSLVLTVGFPPTFDTDTWIMVGLLLALLLMLALAWWQDHIAFLFGAATILFLMSIQMWTITLSYPASIALACVAILVMVIPVGTFMETRKEVH